MPPETVGLLSVANVTTGSSNTVDAKDDGAYPFYDRSQVVKRSDKYLFDREAVIVPGEGMDFIPRYASGKFDLHQRAYAVFPKSSVDGRYLYYAILNNRHHFAQVATGSTVKSLRLKSFELMKIPFVDLNLQLKISKILSNLDDKIALNQSINDNLLNEMRTFFVKTISTEILNSAKLSDIANITMGQSPPGESLSEDQSGTLFYQGRAEFGTVFPSPRLYTSEPKKMAVKNSVLLSVRAPVGDTNLALSNCCIGRGLAAIQSVDDNQSFIHYLIDYLKPRFEAFNGDGTVFGSINKDSINELDIEIPNESCIRQFNLIASKVDAEIEINHLENLKLEAIRDYLLPKLMSGEIDVSSLGNSQLNNHLLAGLILMENLSVLLKSKLIGKLDDDSIDIVVFELTQILRECPVEPDNSNSEKYNTDLLNSFLSAKRLEGCSEKTISYYQSTLQMFLAASGCSIISVTTDHIRNYLSEYQSKRGSGKVTIDNIRRIFSSFFSWLEDEEYILKSPVRRIHKVKFGRTVKETFTDEELERMRDSCDSIRNLSILDTFISTGMRVGELVRLNISDVDFSGRECVVFGKGDCERRVYFDARTKLHLQTYLEHRTDGNPALFVTQHKPTRRISINGVESMLKALGNGAGIKDVHPHKFRRTMATRAIDKGMPIEQVQKLLGHVRIDTTLHYAMVNQENVKNAHRKYVA